MSATAARRVALRAVTRVRVRHAYAHEVVNALVGSAGLDERDAAFASRLAYGAIACRGTLLEIIAGHLQGRRRLEPRVEDALVVAAYELLFMHTPVRAALHEGIELVREVRPQAAGLATAVLHRIADVRDGFPWGDPERDVAAAARATGHPEWLARLLWDELGASTANEVMRANNEPAPVFIATLPFRATESDVLARLSAEGVRTSPTPLEGCYRAEPARAVVRSSALMDGTVVVADAGAQLAASCVPLAERATVIDLCAGRGTKTLLMAARAVRNSIQCDIVAVDVHPGKVGTLEAAVARTGAPHIRTVVADARAPTALERFATAHAVLVDAPCSGLGTLRRHPDKRWRVRPEDLEVLAAQGLSLLRTAAALVGPGGFVVYSTCTIARRENDAVIEAFLRSQMGRDFALDDVTPDVPPAWREFVSDAGLFLSLPRTGGFDGHFIARLRRTGE